ncbi:MAG: hypothetical protein E7408_04265 [Ruminococcaceae bacterium]|nr:hypothetical protein [Oscillospiraceae bacterium]
MPAGVAQALVGEGDFEGFLWQNTWEWENEVFTAFHNGTEETAVMQAEVTGTVAELLYGGAEGSFTEGVLTVHLPPGYTAVFRMLSRRKTGLYAGNILYADRRIGAVVFENYDNSVAALYNGKELIRLFVGGERLDGKGTIKIFNWTGLDPQATAWEVTYAD